MHKRWHLDILCVNKTCNAEATQIIYRRTVSLGIGHSAFYKGYATGEKATSLTEAEKEGLSWSWGPMLPGIQFFAFKELELMVEPIGARGYWYSVRSLLQNLCQSRLETGPPLKALTIKLMDMLRATGHPLIDIPDSSQLVGDNAVPARFEDYETTLKLFEKVIRMTPKCDIYLPYWMEKHERAGWLRTSWGNSLGASVSYMGFPTWVKIGTNILHLNNVWVQKWVLKEDAHQNYGGSHEPPMKEKYPRNLIREDFPCLANLA